MFSNLIDHTESSMPVLILEGVTRFAAGARQIFAHTHPRERWVLMLRPTTKRVWRSIPTS